jgi:hypothetical protein
MATDILLILSANGRYEGDIDKVIELMELNHLKNLRRIGQHILQLLIPELVLLDVFG